MKYCRKTIDVEYKKIHTCMNEYIYYKRIHICINEFILHRYLKKIRISLIKKVTTKVTLMKITKFKQNSGQQRRQKIRINMITYMWKTINYNHILQIQNA